MIHRDLLRLTGVKFEMNINGHAPHNSENGLKIIGGVYVFLAFAKITLNKSLLPSGFLRREI